MLTFEKHSIYMEENFVQIQNEMVWVKAKLLPDKLIGIPWREIRNFRNSERSFQIIKLYQICSYFVTF